MKTTQKILWLLCACALFTWAKVDTPGTEVQVIVTIGHVYGQPAVLSPQDLIVTQHYEQLPVTKLVPLRGERAGLELFLLVDNCSNCEPGSKFEELRRFIGSQPSTTAVGVAYIQDGKLVIAEKPTYDRARAVNALSVPEGSKPSNPYGPLKRLIEGFNPDGMRRAVLIVSNGIDPAAVETVQDASAEAAIDAAQRARVTVYGIYHPSADYLTADFSKIYGGQVQLSHVAFESGGEAYFLGLGPLPSLAPFLADIAEHLANQYLVEFRVNPATAAGSLQEVTVKAKAPELDLMVPRRVWVPESAGAPKTH